MTTADYLIILVFSLIILGTGISFSRTGRSMKSFFAGGGKVPWWISGLSLFMSFFSAGTFVAWGSIAYSSGFVSVGIQWTMAIGGILIFLFIARRWKRTQALTVAEYLVRRFNPSVQKLYTYLFVGISFFTAGSFLYPVAKIVNVSTGFPIHWIILFLGVMILIYTAIGGFWAVLSTDVLQFVILTAAVLVVIPLSFKYIGGVDQFFDAAPADFFKFSNEEFNGWFLLAFGIYNFIFIGGNWAYVQRYTSVANEKEASKVGGLFGILYILFPVVWMLPPMIFRIVDPGLAGPDETEGAYLLMCIEVLPKGMLGLMVAGMVFATASSLNTTLNMMAAVTTNDIYKAMRPESTEKQLINIARISTLLFGIAAMAIALLVPSFGGIVNVVFTVAALTGVAMFGPPIWSLFSKRIKGRQMISVTVISLIVNLSAKFLMPVLTGYELNRANEFAVGSLVPISLLIIVELWLKVKNASKEQYLLYNSKYGQIAEVEVDETDTKDQRFGVRVISTAALVTSSLIAIIGAFSSEGRWLMIGLGLGIMLLALTILLKFRNK